MGGRAGSQDLWLRGHQMILYSWWYHRDSSWAQVSKYNLFPCIRSVFFETILILWGCSKLGRRDFILNWFLKQLIFIYFCWSAEAVLFCFIFQLMHYCHWLQLLFSNLRDQFLVERSGIHTRNKCITESLMPDVGAQCCSTVGFTVTDVTLGGCRNWPPECNHK